jgi:putative endonuclease
MDKEFYVYILANERNTTLYIGVTNNIERRVYEHKTHLNKGFTYKYNITKLVWYDVFPNSTTAILREKQLKKWNREWKERIINEINPEWKDLSAEWFEGGFPPSRE